METEKLRGLVTKALGPAKQNLEEYGQILPVVLIFTEDGRQKTIPVPDKLQVGKTIKSERPDAFVYVAEAWGRDVTTEERKLDSKEFQRLYQEGKIPRANESPNRREIILLIGGTGLDRISLEQKFHRDQGKVVFDGVPEMTDLKVGDSLVDWDDAGDQSPSADSTFQGGHIFHMGKEVDLWVPEGWKLDWERDEAGKETPVWHKEKNPHGKLLVRIEAHEEKFGVWIPLDKATKEAVWRKTRQGVSNVALLDESPERPILSWTQLIPRPNMRPPTRMRAFKVFDTKGAVVIAWTNDVTTKDHEIAEELAAVRVIANRVRRL